MSTVEKGPSLRAGGSPKKSEDKTEQTLAEEFYFNDGTYKRY